MNWIANFVRPRIKALVGKPDVPDNLWTKCPDCGQMMFHRDLDAHHHVCQHCGHHMRLPLEKRLALIYDDGLYETIELPRVKADPLRFRDRKRYTDRLKEAQQTAGRQDAIAVAHGTMGGHRVVTAAFDFAFMGGSMGMAVGEGLVAAARLAVMQQAPLLAIPASGGARMQEGILSLMQMPRTTVAVAEVKEAGLPFFVLFTDPTTGGVSASFAMLGDIHLAEPGATIGFAGRRVIEQTVRETLPDGFQTSEYLLEHGMVDLVTPRARLRETLIGLVDLLMRPGAGTADGIAPAAADETDAAALDIPAPEAAGKKAAPAGEGAAETAAGTGKGASGKRKTAAAAAAGAGTDGGDEASAGAESAGQEPAGETPAGQGESDPSRDAGPDAAGSGKRAGKGG